MTVEEIGRFEAYGFEEPEPGLIPDTEENRQRLIKMKWSWTRDRDEDGAFTGLLQPLDPEQITADREERARNRRHLLVDRDDPWSDYKGPDEIDLDLEMPTWIKHRLRKWREDEAAGIPPSERRTFPTRCTTFRYDGTRCTNWVNRPEDNPRCSRHTSNNKTALKSAAAYARDQLIELLPGAVDNLAYLAYHAEGEAVRLKANTEIMDRGGLSSKTEVSVDATVTAVNPADELRQRLATLTKRAEAIVEEDTDAPLALPSASESQEPVEAELVEEEPA